VERFALDGDAAVEAYRLYWLGRKQGRLNEVSGRWLKAAPAEAKKALVEANRAQFHLRTGPHSGTLVEVVFSQAMAKA